MSRQPRTLTKTAACREYGISRRALEALMAEGTVWCCNPPGSRHPRVVRDGLERWIAAGSPEPDTNPHIAIMPRKVA